MNLLHGEHSRNYQGAGYHAPRPIRSACRGDEANAYLLKDYSKRYDTFSPRLGEGVTNLFDKLAPIKGPTESIGKAKAVAKGGDHQQKVVRQRNRSKDLGSKGRRQASIRDTS
jgi:hypothetical protein